MMGELSMTLALVWRPFAPPMLLFAIAALFTGLAVCMCMRTFPRHPFLSVISCAMRVVLITAITTVLLGPSVIPDSEQRPTRCDLTLMLDLSGSMQTRDAAGSTRIRYALDHWLDEANLDALGDLHNIRLIGFDGGGRSISSDIRSSPDDALAVGRISRIAQVLNETVAEMPGGQAGSAMVVISDGHDSAGDPMHPAARLARQKGIPIHTVTLGGAGTQRDLAVIAEPAQPYLLVDEPGRINVRLLQTNAAGYATRLTTKTADGRTIDTREVRFLDSESVTVELPIEHNEPGTYEYRVTAAPIDGEVEPNNNSQAVFVDVTDKHLQVLILEGEPYWDTKFIAQALRRDDHLGVTQITAVAHGRTEKIMTRIDADDFIGAPRTMADLAAYDIVILGKRIEKILDPETIELLPAYVADHNGRVVLARGRACGMGGVSGGRLLKAMSVLEPVAWGGETLYDQAVMVEPAGLIHPAFRNAGGDAGVDHINDTLPRLRIVPGVLREKPSATVLARAKPRAAPEATGRPALVTMPYGGGMVVAVLGEGMWRWRLAGRKGDVSAGMYDRFWSGMVRWLVMGSDFQPGQALSLRLAQRSVEVGQSMSFDVASRSPLDPAAVDVRVIDAAGQSHGVSLQTVSDTGLRHRGVFEVASPGVHTITMRYHDPDTPPLETRFNAYEIDMERLHNSADPTAMRTLAELSGGRVLDPARPNELLRILERQRASMVVPPRPRYVWDQGIFLVLLLVWVGAEWLIRKRGGLL